VHTSAKARLASVVIRIRDPDRRQNLVICSLAHSQPSVKISCKSVRTFLRKVANRQTNNDDYTFPLGGGNNILVRGIGCVNRVAVRSRERELRCLWKPEGRGAGK